MSSKQANVEHQMGLQHPMNVILYTRPGCHLCDEAHQLLLTHGLTPCVVNIDEDAALREKYDCCVPVVEVDGKIRFRGHIEPLLLRRLLEK
jgi:glutaredoxin